MKFGVLLCLSLILFFPGGCSFNKTTVGLKYIDATVDDLSGKQFEAILIRSSDDPDNTHFIVAIGNLKKAQKIVGHKIIADKVVTPSWIKRLTSHFIKSERLKRLCMCDGRVIFLTKRRGYVIKMSSDSDDRMVYGPDYQSRQLWWDFKEVGLE